MVGRGMMRRNVQAQLAAARLELERLATKLDALPDNAEIEWSHVFRCITAVRQYLKGASAHATDDRWSP